MAVFVRSAQVSALEARGRREGTRTPKSPSWLDRLPERRTRRIDQSIEAERPLIEVERPPTVSASVSVTACRLMGSASSLALGPPTTAAHHLDRNRQTRLGESPQRPRPFQTNRSIDSCQNPLMNRNSIEGPFRFRSSGTRQDREKKRLGSKFRGRRRVPNLSTPKDPLGGEQRIWASVAPSSSTATPPPRRRRRRPYGCPPSFLPPFIFRACP